MTDLLAPTDILGSEPILPELAGIDASAIDRNLRALKHVESVWRLPELPDEVRLDLSATNGLDSQHLQGFLYGLERDLYNDDVEVPVAPAVPQLRVASSHGEFGPLALDGYTQAASIISTMRGIRPIEVADGNATERWKLRAIERGALAAPEDGVVDGTWSPELSGIQRQMQYQEVNDAYSGARFGAIPLSSSNGHKGLMDHLVDWTSPSGLFRAAVDLDLWWDTGQIGKEVSSWGDKWRKVGDSDSPFDFAKNLFDAVTGPIDDLIVPAFNLGLLFTGLGVGTNFARIGMGATAVNSVRTFETVSNIYRVPKLGSLVGRVFPAAGTSAAALGEASWTAQKLVKAGGTAGAVGEAMARWRQIPAVIGTRGIVQTGMKLGVVSRAEHQFLPGFEGKSLADVPDIETFTDRVTRGPLISFGEILFTPYTMFEPGTFTKGGIEVVKGAFDFLGHTAGRTTAGFVAGAGYGTVTGDDTGDVVEGALAGAVGAAALPAVGKVLRTIGKTGEGVFGFEHVSKLVRKTGDVFAHTQWEAIGNDQRMTSLFMAGARQGMDPAQWATFEEGVRTDGFLKTFGRYTGGDETTASATMAMVAVSASIDRTASMQATGAGRGWWEQYYLARNKLVAQVRTFQNPTEEDLAWAIVSKESHSMRDVRDRYDKYLAEIRTDPSSFAELVALHNEQAALTLRQLLSPDNLPLPGLSEGSAGNLAPLFSGSRKADLEAMTGYIAGTVDTWGSWGKYAPTLTSLNDHVQAGKFADVALLPAISYMGTPTKLSIVDDFMPSPIADSEFAKITASMHDTLFLDRSISLPQARQAGFYYSPYAREITPYRSRMTLAKTDTVTKQELHQVADELRRTSEVFDKLGVARGVKNMSGGTLIDQPNFTDLGVNELNAMLRQLGRFGKDPAAAQVRRLHRVLTHMKTQGADITGNPELAVAKYILKLDGDPRWLRYGQSKVMVGADNKVLSGVEALKARRKDLLEQARRTAAEIDADGLVASTRLAKGDDAADELETFFDHAHGQGYKVVYGQEFLMPTDLATTSGLFTDINERHLNAISLGNFFGRKHPEELAMSVQKARQRAVARNLAGVWGGEVRPDDVRVQHAVDDLYRLVIDPERARNEQFLSDVAHQTIIDRVGTSIRTSGQPRSLQDLGLVKNKKRTTSALVGAGWSPEEATAIWRGLVQGRYAEWKDQGLYAIEAKLRGRNQILDMLHVLGGTPNGGRLRKALPGVVAGAYVGSQVDEDNPLAGALVGGAVGGVARLAAGAVTGRMENALNMSEWADYGYMANSLAAFRDRMRFAMSPFFDMSRYTEAYMLGQIAAPKRAADGSRMVLPLNQSPKALRARLAKELGSTHKADAKMTEISDAWSKVSHGTFIDLDAIEDTQRQFQEIGMAGFNPTRWMMSSFHYMRESGMESQAAFEAVRDMYTYGTNARSGFEQSVNFMFFPYSFMKKTAGHAAGWIADDLTRAVLLHDAYKAYELLDKHHNIGGWVEEHAPVLSRLRQLNVLAYGLSPGRLGGVNAPFLDVLVGDVSNPDGAERKGLLFNLLNPIGVNIGEGVSGKELTKLVKRTVPLFNDLDYMMEDLKSQKNVIFDPEHVTRRAQAREGFDQWTEYKKGVDAALKGMGASWYDLYNNPGMVPLKAEYMLKKRELEGRFPGWLVAKQEGVVDRVRLDQERTDRTNTVLYAPEEATVTDYQFVQFETMLDGLKEMYAQYGITDWEDLPADEFARIRGVALEMVKENAGFKMIYDKFYDHTFGLITTLVRP